jgi:hypothetical protein
LATERDAGANLIVTVPRRDPRLPFLACGSHLDSVPQGGKYDGAAGVVAGLLALARFRAEGFQPMMLLRMKSPDPALFQSGRQFAAWIGLTPKDHSTAGKVRLGVITRRWRRGIAQRAGRGNRRDPTCSKQRKGVALAARASPAQVAEIGRRGAGQYECGILK